MHAIRPTFRVRFIVESSAIARLVRVSYSYA